MKLRPLAFVLAALTAIVPAAAYAQRAERGHGAEAHAGRGHRGHRGHRGERLAQNLTPARAEGAVTRYIVGPEGRVRAALLSDGATVLLGRSGDAVAQRIAVGQRMSAQGFSFGQGSNSVVRATVSDAAGNVVAQPSGRGFGGARGPGQGPAAGLDDAQRQALRQQLRQRLEAMPEAQREALREQFHQRFAARRAEREARVNALPVQTRTGVVQQVLTGPRGMAHALLLSDGSAVYLPRDIGRTISERGVAPGAAVRATGHGDSYQHGTAVVADTVVLADGTVLTHTPRAARGMNAAGPRS